MQIQLTGPESITHYKSIRGPIAGDALVYLGRGGDAPQYQNGAFAPHGPHPGRWVDPQQPTTVTTTGGVGHFLAVATPKHSHPPDGAIVVLTQHSKCTHLGIVTSAEHHAPGGPENGYRWYRWVYVLAIRTDLRVVPASPPAFFKVGAAYIAHANCKFEDKDAFRAKVWAGFLAAEPELLAQGLVTVPQPPPWHLLGYPATYP
ncbi:MAG: hypothetical protein JNM72_23800 [Deltaproteobacteria bacterium]|nr:hypothetical protein [Deltaproteobacteria bacterium]